MSSSSRSWLREHFTDPYVKRAQQEGYPSRAAYKLMELDDRDHFLPKKGIVVDLGAAPGGWSMVARDRIGEKGRLIALDILEMPGQTGIEFILGDFTDEAVYQKVLETLGDARAHVVLSDMAPNMSGTNSVDQPKSLYLVELAWQLAEQILATKGAFVAKVFQGAGVDTFSKQLKGRFDKIYWRKPDASRARSREVYLVATGFRG